MWHRDAGKVAGVDDILVTAGGRKKGRKTTQFEDNRNATFRAAADHRCCNALVIDSA